MAKVLLTAFEAFLGREQNASQLVLEALQIDPKHDGLVVPLLLPVSFSRVWSVLTEQVEPRSFDYIILMGEAAEASAMRLERIALNLMDAMVADNDQYIPSEQLIDPAGPLALQTKLSLRQLQNSLAADHSFDVRISNHAGSFVCNYLYYKLLSHIEDSSTKALFVHLPLCNYHNEGTPFTANGLAQGIEKLITSMVHGV
jgi:pyroglutamyl-peptidase